MAVSLPVADHGCRWGMLGVDTQGASLQLSERQDFTLICGKIPLLFYGVRPPTRK